MPVLELPERDDLQAVVRVHDSGLVDLVVFYAGEPKARGQGLGRLVRGVAYSEAGLPGTWRYAEPQPAQVQPAGAAR